MIDWTEIIIAVIGLVFTSILIPLIKAAFTWLKTKTESDTLLTAITEAQTVAETVVMNLQQTVVNDLKAKSADGRLTADEVSKVAEMALEQFYADISEKSLEFLEAHTDDIEAYIKRTIEAQLLKLKG